MERAIVDLWVGIFVAAGLVALLVLAFKVSNASTLPGRAGLPGHCGVRQHRRAQGARAGEERRGAGRAGRVGHVRQRKFVARVTLKIDGRYPFPTDTMASILTSGLLGEQYVGLDAGGDDADGQGRGPHEAHAVRRGAGEADRAVPVQQVPGSRLRLEAVSRDPN